MGVLLVVLLAAAPPSSHRARAERAETLGHMQEAAREYEAAWQDEQAPELLYRLGIVRRKLKQYGKAREAFRAYLRDAPEGGLREEVERQLRKLEVLIEAQTEDYSDEPVVRPPARAPPMPSIQPIEPIRAAAAPVIVLAPPLGPAPIAAMAPTPVARVSTGVRAAPWLAGGAAVAAAAGAYLWWDGARISRDLDARYAVGDLSTADRPSYSRAHAESIAGRALAATALVLGAVAVATW